MAEQIIKITRNDLIQLAQDLTKAQVDKAMYRGINYAIAKSRTRMKAAILNEYKMPASAVVASDNSGTLVLRKAGSGRLIGCVSGDTTAISIAKFNPTQYKDNVGFSTQRGGGGGGFTKISKRGAGYASTRNLTRNTRKSGIFVEIVRGNKMTIPGAWLWFKGTSPIVMARGTYQGTGQTNDFKFDKARLPINKLNTKSIYWGVMQQRVIPKWEPPTEKEYTQEAERQIMLMLNNIRP